MKMNVSNTSCFSFKKTDVEKTMQKKMNKLKHYCVCKCNSQNSKQLLDIILSIYWKEINKISLKL